MIIPRRVVTVHERDVRVRIRIWVWVRVAVGIRAWVRASFFCSVCSPCFHGSALRYATVQARYES